MKSTLRWVLSLSAAALLLALGFAAVACGGTTDTSGAEDAHDNETMHMDGDDEATHTEGAGNGDEAAQVEDGGEADQTVIHTTLDEWSIAGHEGAAEFSVPVGDVTFEVHNDGATVHELVVLRTDLAVNDLPMSGGTVDEEGAGRVLGRTSQFGSGEMEMLSYALEPGTYALICNIAGHYQQGMFAQLTVE